MARAETIEAVAENEVGRNGPLPCHNTCRMEVPRPLRTWPNALTRSARSGSGVVWHHYQHLEPFQALSLSLPFPHPEGPEGLRQASPSSTPPPSPGSDPRSHGTDAQSDSSTEPSDSDKEKAEENQHDSSRRGPLPDLLPHNEHLSRASAHLRVPGGEAAPQLDVSRVASQLRTIGDEFNATIFRRAHGAPHWRDWRDVCRGLFNFITQTLSTLYRLT